MEELSKYSDWRLPTIDELLTIVDYTRYGSASKIEDTVSYNYWSSSTSASYANSAWYVNFYSGSTFNNDKYYSLFVRCVRDGEYGLEWSKSQKEMSWDEAIKFANNLVSNIYYIPNKG